MRWIKNRIIRLTVVGSIMFSISLSGCSYNEELDGEMQIEPATKEAVSDDLDIQILEEISVNVKGFDMENPHCDYMGEAITIEYQYMADASESFGIMILCDGLAVPFYTELSKEEKLLHVIPKENGETVDVNLYVVPRGQNGDTVTLSIIDIVEPDYNLQAVENMTAEAATKILINGKKYSCYYTGPITVEIMADGLREEEDICQEFVYTEIPSDVLEENMFSSEDGKINNQLQYFKGEFKINDYGSAQRLLYNVKQGEILSIEITYHGTNGQEVMTSCYLDNEIYPVFDDKNYAGCYVDSSHYSTIKGKIDTSELEKGTHVFYMLCGNVPYNEGIGFGTNAFILVVE